MIKKPHHFPLGLRWAEIFWKNSKKGIDRLLDTRYNVVRFKGGVSLSPKSRAEYFRMRRKKFRQLVFMVDNDKAEKLDSILNARGEKRIDWFRRKLDEEIGEKE